MSVRGVTLDCDTSGCGAYCQMSVPSVEAAIARAVERYEWSACEGQHWCGPCTRKAAEGR